jgi:hypothetical protein
MLGQNKPTPIAKTVADANKTVPDEILIRYNPIPEKIAENRRTPILDKR